MLADHAEAETGLALGDGGVHGRGYADTPFFQLVGEEPCILILADQDRQDGSLTGQADIQVAAFRALGKGADRGAEVFHDLRMGAEGADRLQGSRR